MPSSPRTGRQAYRALNLGARFSSIATMTCTSNFTHLASYNQWMNRKLYDAASVLSDEQLTQNRGAFFGSVLGTLNHIAVGDILWLKRIANYLPGLASLRSLQDILTPKSLDQQLCTDFAALTNLRSLLDEAIINLCNELTQQELNAPLEYTSTKGIKGKKFLSEVLLHFFNHQTHHRGQVTTLFSQLGIDVGATDLILLIPNQP